MANGRLSPGVRESSGLAPSRKIPGIYWTHNDSGGGPWLFALDAAGRQVGRVLVKGAANLDWEDLASDETGRLYIADVGDNQRRRKSVRIYTVVEPRPGRNAQATVESTLDVTYARPRTGRL